MALFFTTALDTKTFQKHVSCSWFSAIRLVVQFKGCDLILFYFYQHQASIIACDVDWQICGACQNNSQEDECLKPPDPTVTQEQLHRLVIVLGLVVERPIDTNLRLNFNLGFFIPWFKSGFGVIFLFLFEHPIIKL